MGLRRLGQERKGEKGLMFMRLTCLAGVTGKDRISNAVQIGMDMVRKLEGSRFTVVRAHGKDG